jgi:lipoprotein
MKKYVNFLLALLVVVFVASCDRNDTVMETPLNTVSSVEQAKTDVSETRSLVNSPLIQSFSKTDSIFKNWNIITLEKGVVLLKSKFQETYVVVASLKQGAKFGLVYEVKSGRGTEKALFTRKKLEDFGAGQSFFALSNALFFYDASGTGPVMHTFPFKQFGDVPTLGKSSYELTNRAALIIYNNYADIQQLPSGKINISSLHKFGGEKVYVALDYTSKSKSYDSYVGRTMVGICDQDGDGRSEILCLLVSKSMKQSEGSRLLKENFGCTKMMAFDGGGSSQLFVQGKHRISGIRKLTSAFIIKSAQ